MFQDAVRQNTTKEDEEEVAEEVLFLMFCTYSNVCVDSYSDFYYYASHLVHNLLQSDRSGAVADAFRGHGWFLARSHNKHGHLFCLFIVYLYI